MVLVWSPKKAIMRSGTCPRGTFLVLKTCNYEVWQLSSWHLSGHRNKQLCGLPNPTQPCALHRNSPTNILPPSVGMIYSIPKYIFKNVYSPTLRPEGAQKPYNSHWSPKCWHDIFNTNIYIQKCIFPNPAPEGRTETLQLTFFPQGLRNIHFWIYMLALNISCQHLGDEC